MIEDFEKITKMLAELVDSTGLRLDELEELPQTQEVIEETAALKAAINEIMRDF